MTARPLRRALISVSDKTGLIDLARALAARGVEILSTGGSAQTLRDAGLTVRDVAEVTGSPEMMDGRVKTLHPAIHGGLLALRDDPVHAAAMEAHGIGGIDLLVVNLYPFEATVASGADEGDLPREHRHRRAGDDPRGCQEYRLDLRDDRPGGLRRAAGGAGDERRGDDAALPDAPVGHRLWTHRRLRRRRRHLDDAGRSRAAPHRRRRNARAGSALRREPASARGLLHRRQRAGGRGDGGAASGQGSELQQHRRHGCRRRARGRVWRYARRRDRQARQPLRRGDRGDAGRGLRACLRLRPDVGLRRYRRAQRDTGRGDGARDPGSLHRSGDRARRDRGGEGALRGQGEPASADDGPPARSGRPLCAR